MQDLKLGELKNSNGNIYEFIGVARHSETLDKLAIYKALYDSEKFGKNAFWAIPPPKFLDIIDTIDKKIPPISELKPGKYQHYKGNFYEFIGVARHSETLDELVIYKGLYNSEEFGKNPLWVRPKHMFLEDVEFNGKKVPRYKYLEKD